MVEDVAEAVPLGRALQRHGDHVVRAADAVREALVAALGVGAGVEHGVHRVGAPPPALLRAVRVEATATSEKLAPRRTSAAPSTPLGVVEEVQRAEDVVGAPAAPVGAALRRRGDGALGVAAVERGRVCVHVSDVVQPTAGRLGKRRCLMTGITGVDTVVAVNLASLDLNLLVSLDALLQERSVTRAAARMGLSQPALSASLARLRRHFGDELLTRVGNEYRLTPLAVQLRELRAAGADRRGAGVRRPDRVRPGVVHAGVLRCWSATTSSRSSATPSPQLLAEEAPHARLRLTANTPPAVDRADQVPAEHRPAGAAARVRHRSVPPGPVPRRVGLRRLGRQPGGRGRAHRRGPGDAALGRHLPRPDGGHARPPARCACAASNRTSRWSPRTS